MLGAAGLVAACCGIYLALKGHKVVSSVLVGLAVTLTVLEFLF